MQVVTPVFVGVAGGTGSGKSTVVRSLVDQLGHDDVAVIQHDSYYRDRSHLPPAERVTVNYDHPDALETSLLVTHLKMLAHWISVEVPVYDFATHTRRDVTCRVEPQRVIIVEGILTFTDQPLRDLMDIRIFVQTDDDVRFIRRLERDIRERGRTMSQVVQQYLSCVKPMHSEFVEPSKRYADLIVPEGGHNRIAIDVLVTKIRSLISGTSAIPPRTTNPG